MRIRRVALIYDDARRPETTGVYCRRALESLVAVDHFRPPDLERVPRSGFDLYLNIDDGFDYEVPAFVHPTGWWAIDTHVGFERCVAKGRVSDLVFATQRDGAARMRAEGIASCSWLPLACDPAVHSRHEVEKVHDVSFVGNLFPGPRAELVREIRLRFGKFHIGQAYFEEMARVYSASRIVFNRSIRNDVNMRVFEALGCGTLLLTNDNSDNGQAELFRDGVHLATYSDQDELIDKLRYYLKHDAIRERIAAAGRAEALARHTYRHRMAAVLEEAEKFVSTKRFAGVQLPPAGAAGTTAREPPASEFLRHAPEGWEPTDDYFEFPRPDLLALVPETARRVLEVGCGAGRLGEAIKARQNAEVVGVEASAAAMRARTRLDRVVVGDVEASNLDFASGTFDCIVCGDVLEHLRDAEAFLKRARGWLAKGGVLVASLPNVRNHSVVTGLLGGNWTYESAGLLDATHRSFYTRRDMLSLFERAGYRVTQLAFMPGPGYEEWKAQGSPHEVRVGALHIGDLPPEEAEEFFAYQYLITAEAVAVDGGPREDARPTLRFVPSSRNPVERLRIAFLGNFEQTWSTEGYAAEALERIGHQVHRIHEYRVRSADEVLDQIGRYQADCLVFFKGRIGVDTGDAQAVLRPDPSRLVDVLRRSPVPGYLWYFDRVHGYDAEPSRLAWMRHVAPHCRVAFVTDGGLTTTDWAAWHVLRQGIHRPSVEEVEVPEHERDDIAFIGQLYGARSDELLPVRREFHVNMISDVFGRGLTALIRRHRITLGPRYPSAPGYWSDRLYVVLGHGGFFLAPEIPGMRDEGFAPGIHYAPLGDDPISDIRYWLARPIERERIARQGQELVLSRFTYEDRVRELCAVIAETLEPGSGLSRRPHVGHCGGVGDPRRREADTPSPPLRGERTGEAGAPVLPASGNGLVAQGHSSTSTPSLAPTRRSAFEVGVPALAGPAPAKAGTPTPPTQRVQGHQPLRFRHRRKLGDTIYSLPVIRHLGGGILYLDPASHDGVQDQAHWRQRFETLLPYLKEQPYLEDVRIYEGEEFDVDLDAYLRTTHGTPGDRVAIAANHFVGLGLEVPDIISPWLVADSQSTEHPILIHRSQRYHGLVDYSFLREIANELYCVGSDDECRPFEAIGARSVITKDVRTLAAAINRCRVFIGNQSLPLALAAGLGKRRMVEESALLPNVLFHDAHEVVLTNVAEVNRAGLRKLLENLGERKDRLPQPDRLVAASLNR